LYIWSFRNEGAFHEAVTNRILDDLVRLLAPRFMRITASFFVRGGIYTTVVAEHRKRGWKPASRIELPVVGEQSSTRS
jgi:7-cyano-7-deazaguanine reductase